MGIYERDYIRPQNNTPRGGGGGGFAGGMGTLRRMSITNLLILINVLVFFVDLGATRFIGPVWSPASARVVEADAQPPFTLDKSAGVRQSALGPAWAVVERNSGDFVGWQPVRVMHPLESIGHFSTWQGFFRLEVWRLVTFQFLHADISHLIFNMVGLWFFGPLVENWLRSRKLFLAFYLMCGLCGGMLYLLLNLLGTAGVPLPGALDVSVYTPLIGASAGCFGILLASAFIAGDSRMLLFFVIPLKVKYGAYLFTAISAFNLIIGASNAGGEAAHLGGAIAGFFFIRRPGLLNEFFDIFGRSGPSKRQTGPKRESKKDRAKLDAILDKVKEQGVQSLTDSEKAFLDKQSEKMRG